MTTAFRHSVLASALLAAGCGAFAAPVTINFDDLGQQAIKDGKPVALTSTQGVNFSGAFVYEWDMLKPGVDTTPAPSNLGGFLINRDRGADPTDIVVSLETLALASNTAGKNFPNQYFSSISLSLFAGGTLNSPPPKITYTANGKPMTVELPKGGPSLFWSDNNVINFNEQDQVTELRFSNGTGVFGLDNLVITLTDPGTGGNVPEPAGYALVGMALLAAGAASRRRRG